MFTTEENLVCIRIRAVAEALFGLLSGLASGEWFPKVTKSPIIALLVADFGLLSYNWDLLGEFGVRAINAFIKENLSNKVLPISLRDSLAGLSSEKLGFD